MLRPTTSRIQKHNNSQRTFAGWNEAQRGICVRRAWVLFSLRLVLACACSGFLLAPQAHAQRSIAKSSGRDALFNRAAHIGTVV